MYATPIAAASAMLNGFGFSESVSTGTTTYSACDPSRLIPSVGELPHTSTPSSCFPFTTTPAKSRPGVRGRVVFLKCPATSPTSLGLIAAACTWTSTSPSPGCGIATSSIRSTEGGPNSAKRNALITLVFMALIHSSTPNAITEDELQFQEVMGNGQLMRETRKVLARVELQ